MHEKSHNCARAGLCFALSGLREASAERSAFGHRGNRPQPSWTAALQASLTLSRAGCCGPLGLRKPGARGSGHRRSPHARKRTSPSKPASSHSPAASAAPPGRRGKRLRPAEAHARPGTARPRPLKHRAVSEATGMAPAQLASPAPRGQTAQAPPPARGGSASGSARNGSGSAQAPAARLRAVRASLWLCWCISR